MRVLILALALSCAPCIAHAVLIQGTFAGQAGTSQQVTGTFRYDTDLAPADYCGSPVDGCYDYTTSTDTWMQIVFSIGGVDYAMSNLDGSTEDGGVSLTEQARVTPAPGFEGGGDRWSIVDFDLSSSVQSYGFLYLFADQLFDTDALTTEFSWSSDLPGADGYGQFNYLDLSTGQLTSVRFTLTSLSATATSVPEPATLGLLGLGLAGLGFARRRKLN